MGTTMRRVIAFPCAGELLAGTLDEAPGKTGLLIVSGGNEIRIGAHRGMAELAARLSAVGIPVLRFDRRGIGDSTGENAGFESSADDIAAAAAAFVAEAGVERVVALGNCDAATALALWHRAASLDALILTNPWVVEPSDDMPPAAAIRAHYLRRLRNPSEWPSLIRNGINIPKFINGLARIFVNSTQDQGLAHRVAAALESFRGPIAVFLARGDNTAIAFRDAWNGEAFHTLRQRASVIECDTASHSFARAADKQWLFEEIHAVVRQHV